jgi:hypothetical protein
MPEFLTRALLLLAVVSSGSAAQAADVRLEGQVVCCEDCWNKADGTKTPFGTTEDLAKSAGCVAGGDPKTDGTKPASVSPCAIPEMTSRRYYIV